MSSTKRINVVNETNKKQHNSYKVVWEKLERKLSLHSYVVDDKNKCKQNTLLLSTVSICPLGSTHDSKEMPAVLKLYELTKGVANITICQGRVLPVIQQLLKLHLGP